MGVARDTEPAKAEKPSNPEKPAKAEASPERRRYIGIDIAKASFIAAWQTGADRWHCDEFHNTQAGFDQLVARMPEGACYVMEASGPYHLRLAAYLHGQGRACSVVNPLSVHRFAQMRLTRAKTDRGDARLIADYAALAAPQPWSPPALHISELAQIEAALEGLTKQRTMVRNQLGALSEQPFQSPAVQQSYEHLLKQLDREIKALERKQEELGRAHCGDRLEALLSIPGIGMKTALLLIAITHNFERFDTSAQLCAYAGLCPRLYESGTSVRGRAHIARTGDGRLRQLLYLCAWSAKRCNEACRALYERLKEKGKPEKVIKVAIANKLLRQAFAIGKSINHFDPLYQPKTCF